MKNFAKILVYALKYKVYALLNILFNILSVVFDLLSMLLFIPFLNLLFSEPEIITVKPTFAFTKEYFQDFFNYTLSAFIQDNDKVYALLLVCVTVGILFFLKNVTRYLGMYFIGVVRTGVIRDIRRDVYQKLLALPLSFYSEEKKGDILARITNDVQEIEWSILSSLEMIFREPLTILLSILTMIVINPSLTLFSLILLPISGLVIGWLGKSLKRSSSRAQLQMGLLLSNVEETLTGLRIIKAFNAEKSSQNKFNRINEDYNHHFLKMTRKRDLASPLSEFLGSMVMVALVYYGGSLVLNNPTKFSGGEFIGYIIIFGKLIAPVKAVTTAYSNVQKGAASADRINMIMHAENNIKEVGNPHVFKGFDNKIEYKDVSFTYGNEPVLKKLNFTIEKGKTIALVGESGGGKSTLADLLPRFYDVVEGELLIDGINVKKASLKSVRNLMGVVTQESILFNDTVFNNIAFGIEATKEQVIEAAKIANAHQFIVDLENGYDTNIGDRGGKLSGGQRQRISIARAVLKNPPILILDEATSALDTESEKLVQDALYKLMQNRTSVVIAHRLSTIQHADEILVLVKGEIIERGTHNELLNKNGVYKKLSDLQTFAN